MIKNTAGQKVGAQLVSATDGSAFTGSVTVAVTVDAGVQATGSVGAGACTHEGNGYHTYAPSQAETNGDLIAFTFTGTGAVPQTVQIYTRAATPDVNVSTIAANAITATALAADAITDAKVAADVTIASVTGAVGSVTAAVTVGTNNDKTGYSLSAAGIQAIWDALTSALTTVGSIGKLLVDNINATISSRSSLDAAGVRTAVGLATANLDTQLGAIDDFLDTEIAAILVDTGTTLDDLVDDLELRLTAALATALQAHGLGIGRGVVGVGSTTTSIVFSTVNDTTPSATNDFYNGRHIVFTSGALALQATSITDYDGTTKAATVPGVTSAPANGDTFIIV